MPTSPPVDGPHWFQAALSVPREHRFVTVDACPISYWRWGRPGSAGVVLVHGGGAHARWWDHVAPLLASPERTVAAIDLSGHGDSGHRDSYSLGQWASEMLAVAADAGFTGPPILVGHSLGGWSTVVAAADHAGAVAGLVLVDSRVIDPAADPPPAERPPPRPPRHYATLEEVQRRYRPEPFQEGNVPYVVAHLAAASARAVDGGWRWKFDPSVLHQRRPGAEALGRVRCPVAIIRGEHGLLTEEVTDAMRAALGWRLPVVDVPLAGHHLMLDQPLSLVTALRALLAGMEQR